MPFADRLLTLGRVDDQGQLAVLDHVDDVRSPLAHLVDTLAHDSAVLQSFGGAARRYDLEAARDQHLAEFDDAGLVAVTRADDSESAARQAAARGELRPRVGFAGGA